MKNWIGLALSTSLIVLAACDGSSTTPDAAAAADAGWTDAAPTDAGPADAGTQTACAALAERASTCVAEYEMQCQSEALEAACDRLLVDGSPLLTIGTCIRRGECIDGVVDGDCVGSLAEGAPTPPVLDSVIETLCDACPLMAAAGHSDATTPEACVDVVTAAVEGTSASFIDRIIRDRYLLLSESQLVALRDCVAAEPTCDAFEASACGGVQDDLTTVLSAQSPPECE